MADASTYRDAHGAPAERDQRVLIVLIPLIVSAALVLGATGPTLTRFLREGHVAIVVTLLAAAVATRAFRVPLADVGGSMSFELVVVLSAAILYGAAVAMIVAAIAELLVHVAYRRRLMVLAYNGASAVLQAGAAGAVAGLAGGAPRPGALLAVTGGAALAWMTVNVSLGCVVLALTTSVPKLSVLNAMIRATAAPFVFMTSLVPLVIVAWRESPLVAVAAFGPILAIGLYQARRLQAATANVMALTDSLTGLGNRRHFEERLARELERAHRFGTHCSLCLLDLDGFKAINDTYGHAAGDALLAATAACLRRGGEAFRCGGDEFALLLPAYPQTAAVEVSAAVCARIHELTDPSGHAITASAGTATVSPAASPDPAAILQAADAALYKRKKQRQDAGSAEICSRYAATS